MNQKLSSEALRNTLKRLGVSKVARVAGVNQQTLYKFAQGRTEHLRSDTRMKVIKAIAEMTGSNLHDDHLERMVSFWDQLSPEQRKLIADMAENMVLPDD